MASLEWSRILNGEDDGGRSDAGPRWSGSRVRGGNQQITPTTPHLRSCYVHAQETAGRRMEAW